MMMRRVTGAGLLLLLGLSVTGWVIYMPPQLCNPLRAVPAEARLLFHHSDPAVVRPFFQALNDPAFSVWKEQFPSVENAPLAVAAAPLRGRDRSDSRMAVSAPGMRALLLHWQLVLAPPEGVVPQRSYGGWPVWKLDNPALPPEVRIRFSIADGLLICSVSDDSHDIYRLLDTLDGRRPSHWMED
jgi:hypothetical protein